MRVVLVNQSVPHCFHGGGGVTAYSMVKALVDRGEEVHIVALASNRYNGNLKESDHIRHLESELGITVDVLEESEGPRGRRRWPTFKDQFPHLSQAQAVAKRIERVEPDVLLGYHWAALSAMYGITGYPKVGLVGDPIHLPELFRGALNRRSSQKKSVTRRLREWLLTSRNVRAQKTGMALLLNACDRSGAFAAHHAQDFRDGDVLHCEYFRTPTPDPSCGRTPKPQGEPFKIMHIGHLKGVATLAGVELLAEPILPILEKSLPPNSFEVHLVGGFYDQIPGPLKHKLGHPAVKARGQINPPNEEFRSSHVVLVPTPIELGIRVRIITAFSFGSCIVAHQANQKGIPELKAGYNCLLGKNGPDLAGACLQLSGDVKLRRTLEKGARETYEKYFSIKAAGGEITDTLSQAKAQFHSRPGGLEIKPEAHQPC